MIFTVKHWKNAAEGVGLIFTSTLCCNFACNLFQLTWEWNSDSDIHADTAMLQNSSFYFESGNPFYFSFNWTTWDGNLFFKSCSMIWFCWILVIECIYSPVSLVKCINMGADYWKFFDILNWVLNWHELEN